MFVLQSHLLLGISSASQNPACHPVQTHLEWLDMATRQCMLRTQLQIADRDQSNTIRLLSGLPWTNTKVIAILGATATVVRGADGHKTNLVFGKRNQTNHIQSGGVLLCYMHQATRYCAVIVYHINTILRFKVKTYEKTRWEVSLQQHPQCPFSIMLGTPLQTGLPRKNTK